MASKQRAYLVVLKVQAMEVAEKISKEATARQFRMCMVNDDKLNGILENTNLHKFELPVTSSP